MFDLVLPLYQVYQIHLSRGRSLYQVFQIHLDQGDSLLQVYQVFQLFQVYQVCQMLLVPVEVGLGVRLFAYRGVASRAVLE